MTKFLTHSLLRVTALTLILSSCLSENILSDPPLDETGGGNKSILLRITQQAPTTRGVSRPIPNGELLEFHSGNLYLVNSIGIVVRHFIVTPAGGTASTFETGGRIINISDFDFDPVTNTYVLPLHVNVPNNVTYVYMVGNTPGTGNDDDKGSRINTIVGQGMGMNILSQHDAWNVNLFGKTRDRLVHTPGQYNIINGIQHRIYRGELYLAPTVARFEIGEIRGAGDIAQFTVAGIYMDNFVARAHINGELIINSLWSGNTNANAFALNGSVHFMNSPTSQWALFDEPGLSNTLPSLSVRPSSVNNHVWSYQVFAPSERTTTTLTSTQQPRIILRLSGVRLIGAAEAMTGYRFVTVRSFFDGGAAFSGIQAGEVYHIPVVMFDETDLRDAPNMP